MRLILCAVILVLLNFHFSYAGQLASQEATNYFNEGVNAQKSGNLAVADSSYRKTLLVNPNTIEYRKFILNNMGAIFAERGEFDKAEEAFKEALLIDPDYKPALMNLGLIYDATRDRLSALEYWARAFRIDQLKPRTFVIEDQQKEE